MPRSSPDIHQKSFRIKHDDDKFFTRLLSKERSKPNSSFRVYYGDVSSTVPFIWETRPGTPKLEFHENSMIIPPLTPPPSYNVTNINLDNSSRKNSKPKLFLRTFLRRMSREKGDLSSSSSCSSPSRDPMIITAPTYVHSRGRSSSWAGDEAPTDNHQDRALGFAGDGYTKRFHRWYSVYFVKKAFLSIVGRRSS